ncbi:hypothetical protein Dimus_015070 [Dionaea muscipula]
MMVEELPGAVHRGEYTGKDGGSSGARLSSWLWWFGDKLTVRDNEEERARLSGVPSPLNSSVAAASPYPLLALLNWISVFGKASSHHHLDSSAKEAFEDWKRKNHKKGGRLAKENVKRPDPESVGLVVGVAAGFARRSTISLFVFFVGKVYEICFCLFSNPEETKKKEAEVLIEWVRY